VTKLTPVHPGNWIELPPEWVAEMGLSKYAALEKTKNGIIVSSCSDANWDEVFLEKLHIGTASESPSGIEMNGDSVLL